MMDKNQSGLSCWDVGMLMVLAFFSAFGLGLQQVSDTKNQCNRMVQHILQQQSKQNKDSKP